MKSRRTLQWSTPRKECQHSQHVATRWPVLQEVCRAEVLFQPSFCSGRVHVATLHRLTERVLTRLVTAHPWITVCIKSKTVFVCVVFPCCTRNSPITQHAYFAQKKKKKKTQDKRKRQEHRTDRREEGRRTEQTERKEGKGKANVMLLCVAVPLLCVCWLVGVVVCCVSLCVMVLVWRVWCSTLKTRVYPLKTCPCVRSKRLRENRHHAHMFQTAANLRCAINMEFAMFRK